MAWYERFLASWPEIADNYSERFKRMFTYYLNACAGAFRARDIRLLPYFLPQMLYGQLYLFSSCFLFLQQAITGGKATISGSQSLEEAKDLAILLRSGALPVKINVLEVRTVGPSLGQDSKDKSVVAFSAGIAMIMIFLVILYRFSGIVANIALLVYVMLLLLVLGKGFNATMTLPGIAGIILSMGVAVDANILIFERFKEEVFSGKSMRVAMEAGFSRALATITDANVSVIITAGILTILGSGPVKGFAISLGVGVVVSMFTAITVSHFLLRLLIDCNFTNHPFWFGANISPSKSADAFAPKSLKGGKRK